MKIKSKLQAFAVVFSLVLCAFLLQGCVTGADGKKRPDCDKIASAIQIAAPPLVQAVLVEHPELREDFTLAANSIRALAGADPRTLQMGVELKVANPLVRAAVGSALALWKLEGEQLVTNNACAVTLSLAIANALSP